LKNVDCISLVETIETLSKECEINKKEREIDKKEREEDKKEIERLKAEAKPVIINNNFNINLTGYGAETYSNISFEYLRELWNEVNPDYGEFVRKLVQKAHKDNPNLKITNLRSNNALEYNGSQYESVPMTEAIGRCLEHVAKCLDENIPIQKKMLRMQLSTRLNDMVEEKYLDFDDEEEKQEEFELHKKCNNGVKNGLYKPK
jgi:uncharacterized protein YneF (UPF0154 family)